MRFQGYVSEKEVLPLTNRQVDEAGANRCYILRRVKAAERIGPWYYLDI